MPQFRERIHDQEEFDHEINWVYIDHLNIDYMPFLNKLMDDLEDLHGRFFTEEQGPGPNRWPALAPSTVAAKGHADILFDTGRLRASLTQRTSDSVREAFQENDHAWIHFGTDVPYSHFHESSNDNLPYRPHVGISDSDVDALAGLVLDYRVEELRVQQ